MTKKQNSMVGANVKIIAELNAFLDTVATDPQIRVLFTQSPTDFTRNRKLPLRTLVGLMINMPKRSLSVEIEDFFDQLKGPAALHCTKGAFCLQRVKLQVRFFQLWNQWLVDHFYHYYGPAVKRWRGFLLYAVDGSHYNLLNQGAVSEHFGTHGNQFGQKPLGRVVQVQDVLNELTVWGGLFPLADSENAIIARQVHRLPVDSLTLFDRGYAGYSLMYLMNNEEMPRHFVIRCKTGFNNEVKAFLASGKPSAVTWFYPHRAVVAQLRTHRYRVTCATPLKIRMVRVRLSATQTEVLLTNLYDEQYYPASLFKELYALRWKIETTYSQQKNQLQAELFSGHKPICLLQDYAASLFVANLQRLIEKQCQPRLQASNKKRALNYKINRNVSWAALKHRIVRLFLRPGIRSLLLELQKIFERHLEPVRPGRQYPRNTKPNRYTGKYSTFTNYKRAI